MSEQFDADKQLSEMVLLSGLYDLYGNLLNDHKRYIFECYVMNNLSLSEIAEEVGLSRQGVRDIIIRCTKQLKEYEDKLHLMKRMDELSTVLDEMKETLNDNFIDIDNNKESSLNTDAVNRLKSLITNARELLED